MEAGHDALKQSLGPNGWFRYEHDAATGVCRLLWGYKVFDLMSGCEVCPIYGYVIDDGNGYVGVEGQHPKAAIWICAVAQVERQKLGGEWHGISE